MNIEEVFEEKSLKCKAFSGAVSTQNFNNKEEFAVLSDRKKGHYEQDTCFQAASLSKLIAAITTALYCEDNNIAWDAPLKEKLPVPVDDRTTLAYFFAHCAGINVPGFPCYADGPLPCLEDIINGIPPANTEAIRCLLPFGKFSYSGAAIVWCSII